MIDSKSTAVTDMHGALSGQSDSRPRFLLGHSRRKVPDELFTTGPVHQSLTSFKPNSFIMIVRASDVDPSDADRHFPPSRQRRKQENKERGTPYFSARQLIIIIFARWWTLVLIADQR